jgi:hypothetical protein
MIKCRINKNKGVNYMELKPIKEKNEALYPTIKEVPKSNFMKEMLLATAITPAPGQIIVTHIAIAVPANVFPIKICKSIRTISIFIMILSSILLFVNKKKINKCISENEVAEKLKKLNKHRKIKWWIFGISIAIIVISSLAIVYLENYI